MTTTASDSANIGSSGLTVEGPSLRTLVEDLRRSGLTEESKEATISVVRHDNKGDLGQLTQEAATEGCLVLARWLNEPSGGIPYDRDDRKKIRRFIRQQGDLLPSAMRYAYMSEVLSKPWDKAISAFIQASEVGDVGANRTDHKKTTTKVLEALRDDQYDTVSTEELETAWRALSAILETRKYSAKMYGPTDSMRSAEKAIRTRYLFSTANIKDDPEAQSYRLADRAFNSARLGVDRSSAVMACVKSWSLDRMAHLREYTLRLGAEGLRQMADTETKSEDLDDLSGPALYLAGLFERERESRYGTELPCSTDGSVAQVSEPANERPPVASQPVHSVEDVTGVLPGLGDLRLN